MKRWKDDTHSIDLVMRKLQQQCIDTGEADLMFAIYEQAMLDCYNFKKAIHKERVILRTYENKADKELRRLEIFLSGKIILTQKNLNALIHATSSTQKARTRVKNIEKKIMRLRHEQQKVLKFLTHKHNWALYYAGIEPLYAIRLLNEIGFFN